MTISCSHQNNLFVSEFYSRYDEIFSFDSVGVQMFMIRWELSI